MLGRKNELVLRHLRTRQRLHVLRSIDDFAKIMEAEFGIFLRPTLDQYNTEGTFRKWLGKIGEGELAERLRPFEDKGMRKYSNAFRILHRNRKDKKPNFSSVCGMDAEKATLLERVVYPEKMEKLSAKYGVVGGSILLYGPPGCGKTFLAGSLAGEIGRLFLKKSLEDVIGPGGERIEEFIETLKMLGGGVLFIDEMETLAVNRELEGVTTRALANQMLTALNSKRSDSKVLIIGATNTPWMIDPAIVRSGRMDQLIYVGVPNKKERADLVRFFTDGLPMKKIDFESIVERTEFYSRSDIEGLCMEAAAIPWKEAIGGKGERKVENRDFDRAFSVFCPTAIPWFENAANVIFNESARERFKPMVDEIKRYKKWKGV